MIKNLRRKATIGLLTLSGLGLVGGLSNTLYTSRQMGNKPWATKETKQRLEEIRSLEDVTRGREREYSEDFLSESDLVSLYQSYNESIDGFNESMGGHLNSALDRHREISKKQARIKELKGYSDVQESQMILDGYRKQRDLGNVVVMASVLSLLSSLYIDCGLRRTE